MATTKRKAALTVQEVTDNLQRLFPEQQIRCTEILEDGYNRPTFYIETNIMQVAVVGKQVLEKPSIKRWADYLMWCNETGAAYSKVRTKLGTCIPFVYRKGRMLRKQDNECADLILIACGIKAEPKAAKSPVEVLREISGKMYVDIYGVLAQIQPVSARLEEMEDRWSRGLFCLVETATGFYKFNLTGAGKDKIRHIRDEQDEQVKTIFCDLLGISTAVWEKEETQIAA